MNLRMRGCAATAALMIVAGLTAGAAQKTLATPGTAARLSPAGGVNLNTIGPYPVSEADSEIGQAAELRAKVVRAEVPWSVLEPEEDGSLEPRSLAFLDRLMNDADAHGMSVILMVDSSPCWASSAPRRSIDRCRVGETTRANGWPPKSDAAYARFVALLAQRYAPDLEAIEVWNEPDQSNEFYFAGPQKAVRYASLLRAAYTAIKSAAPEVQVLGGSIVGPNGRFLRRLYAAGIKGYYDGLAVHFYTLTLAAVRATREVQLANGDHTPLWLDEFGWSSCWPHQRLQQEQPCVTPAVQAENLTNIFRELARVSYVRAAVMYNLQDSAYEDFGVLGVSGQPKQSYGALRSVLESPFGAPSATTLRVRRVGATLIASGSGPVGDFMALRASSGNGLRYSAYVVLNRFNRFRVVLPRPLGTRGVTVSVYQVWQGPAAAVRAAG